MSDINTDTNSDPEIYRKNQEILEQIEKEQQKKLQEQKAKEDKFNQIPNYRTKIFSSLNTAFK